jgi:catechol 2,3-dioxygenase-like lactoylglutathione lyase family enzyme
MDSEVKSSGTETAARSPGRAFIKAAALNHIYINVRDLTRSVRFYREAFGLVETFRPEANLAFMSPPGSQDSLALHQGVPVGSEGLQHFGFNSRFRTSIKCSNRWNEPEEIWCRAGSMQGVFPTPMLPTQTGT